MNKLILVPLLVTSSVLTACGGGGSSDPVPEAKSVSLYDGGYSLNTEKQLSTADGITGVWLLSGGHEGSSTERYSDSESYSDEYNYYSLSTIVITPGEKVGSYRLQTCELPEEEGERDFDFRGYDALNNLSFTLDADNRFHSSPKLSEDGLRTEEVWVSIEDDRFMVKVEAVGDEVTYLENDEDIGGGASLASKKTGDYTDSSELTGIKIATDVNTDLSLGRINVEYATGYAAEMIAAPTDLNIACFTLRNAEFKDVDTFGDEVETSTGTGKSIQVVATDDNGAAFELDFNDDRYEVPVAEVINTTVIMLESFDNFIRVARETYTIDGQVEPGITDLEYGVNYNDDSVVLEAEGATSYGDEKLKLTLDLQLP